MTSVPSLVDSVQARRTPWAAIGEATDPERLTRPVVLLVDEAQNMSGDPDGDGRTRLLARHRSARDEEARAPWRRRIAEACNGWPQHLHNYLCGASRALADAGGDLGDVDTALATGEDWRREYYDARLDGVNADLPAVADVVRRIPESGAPTHRIVEWCREATGTTAEGSDLHTRMIHDGVLQEMPDGLVTCPIPSFRRNILAHA